jgi:hypothetical protein
MKLHPKGTTGLLYRRALQVSPNRGRHKRTRNKQLTKKTQRKEEYLKALLRMYN